ncbi:glycosyltransferase family 1 protein [Mariniluteicoccus endophyticus]
MRLVIDLRWTGPEIAGISRYATELARELVNRPDIDLVALVCNDEQGHDIPGLRTFRCHDPQGVTAWREVFLPLLLRRLRPDVVFCPVFFMGLAPHRYRLVLTVHDLIPFHYPQPPRYIGAAARLGWRVFYGSKVLMRLCLLQADHLVTVSETAAAELKEAFPRGAWDVVPNGVRLLAPPPGAPADHASSDSVVYMGVFSQHKNVPRLIEALAHAPEVTLHLLSRIPAEQRAELEAHAARRGCAERVVFHGGVTDEEYAELLRDARCLVTASRLEGFGLPVIEAQSAGTPVACSDIPIFREVTGGAAELFDPDSPRDIAAAWERLRDPVRSAELSAAGPPNAARYTWARSADSLLAVCRGLERS